MLKIASAITLCLAGCDLPPLPVTPKAPTAYHTVSYYDLNTLERDQTKAWCDDNPGLATKVASCDSADTSSEHAWLRSLDR